MTAPGTGIEPAYATALPAPQGGALPTSLEWGALERMAQTLADSDVIPYRLKRKPADVAVILLAAREYGIPPLMALSKLPVVNGTPAPMGELMVALVLRAGHAIRARLEGEGGPVEAMVGVCTTRRRDEPADEEDVLRFTFAEAVTAGLVEVRDGKPYARDNKGNPTPWELYTGNMLRWRAVANACRLRFPDVLLGLSYLPEELGAVVDADGAPIVEAARTAPAAGLSLEARTAQDTATRLADFTGDPAVLDNVLAHAEANGYADEAVTLELGAGASQRLPLREAIAVTRARLEAVVDTTVVEQPAPAAEQPQEAAAPVVGPTAPATPETPQEAPQEAAPDHAEQNIAEAMVYDAVREGSADAIRAAYREGKAAGLLDRVVTAALPPEVDTLDVAAPVTLGALLMALGKRLAAGASPLVLDGPPDDDEAPAGSVPAAGWDADPDPRHPDELPL